VARAVFTFPEELRAFQGNLEEFCDVLFRETQYNESPFLRGIYLTSGLQKGTTVSAMLTRLGLRTQARELREAALSRQRTTTLQLQWARARLARQIAPPITPDDLASLATLPTTLSGVDGETVRDGAAPMREVEGAPSASVAEPATLELASGLVLPILESRVSEPATLELASGLVLPILESGLDAREAAPPAVATMPGAGVSGVSVAAQLERAAETLWQLEEHADLRGRDVDRTRRKVHRVTRAAQAKARSVRTIRAGMRAATARRGGAEAGLASAILAMSDLAPRRVAKKTDVRLGRGSDFAWPTMGRLVQGYGCTGFYLNSARGSCPHFHDGIDIAGYLGTPIRAAAVGVVSYIGWNPWDHKQRAFMVVVAHPNGLETLYGHALPRRDVRVGQLVRRGEVIGYMGSTGMATGVHLHLEMRRGRTTLNPLAFL
jgi:murein DD-endopeptidase MepM/ murein hydrolase activator NlpD